MPDIVKKILVVILTMLVVSGIAWLSRRPRPLLLAENEGAIQPGKGSAWFTVIGGSFMCLAAVWALLFTNAGGGAILVALLGAAIAGFMAPSLTLVHRVRWSPAGIEGPAKMFGPTLGRARTEIVWSDIVKTGKTITGYWFVESSDGRRVYWSYLYPGYNALLSELRRRCPTLQFRF